MYASWMRTELFVQCGGDRGAAHVLASAFFKRLEREENNARIRRDAESADAQTGKRDGIFHARLFQADVRHVADDGFGAIERSAIGQLREGHEILFVLRRHETRGHFVEAPTGQHDEPAVDQQRDRALAQHRGDAAGIFITRPRKQAVERTEKPAERRVPSGARTNLFSRRVP